MIERTLDPIAPAALWLSSSRSNLVRGVVD